MRGRLVFAALSERGFEGAFDEGLARIRLALDDRSRRVQARPYLIELGAPVP